MKRRKVERLGQIAEESFLLAALDVLGHRRRGEGDDRDPRGVGVRAQPCENIVPGHVRQAQVEKDHVRLVDLRAVQPLGSGHRFEQGQVGNVAYRMLDDPHVDGIVFDAQNGESSEAVRDAVGHAPVRSRDGRAL